MVSWYEEKAPFPEEEGTPVHRKKKRQEGRLQRNVRAGAGMGQIEKDWFCFLF